MLISFPLQLYYYIIANVHSYTNVQMFSDSTCFVLNILFFFLRSKRMKNSCRYLTHWPFSNVRAFLVSLNNSSNSPVLRVLSNSKAYSAVKLRASGDVIKADTSFRFPRPRTLLLFPDCFYSSFVMVPAVTRRT